MIDNILGIFFSVVAILLLLLMVGIPIPIGFDRGYVKWISYCGTGHHFHIVYRQPDTGRFQAIHPMEANQ